MFLFLLLMLQVDSSLRLYFQVFFELSLKGFINRLKIWQKVFLVILNLKCSLNLIKGFLDFNILHREPTSNILIILFFSHLLPVVLLIAPKSIGDWPIFSCLGDRKIIWLHCHLEVGCWVRRAGLLGNNSRGCSGILGVDSGWLKDWVFWGFLIEKLL